MTVLICYDGSDDARRAISRAAALVPGSAAVVLHVSKSKIDWSLGPSLGPLLEIPGVDEAILRHAEAELAAGVEFARAAGFDARGELRITGNAVWRTVVEVERELRPSVIVANAQSPVLITHRSDDAADTGPARHVSIGYDGSPTAVLAVDVATSLFPDASFTMTCAWQEPSMSGLLGSMGWSPGADISDALRTEAERIVAQGVDHARSRNVDATAALVPAPDGIGTALLAAARAGGADLICVGTHGHGPVTRALLGSTAQWLVQHADRPVLVVPVDLAD